MALTLALAIVGWAKTIPDMVSNLKYFNLPSHVATLADVVIFFLPMILSFPLIRYFSRKKAHREIARGIKYGIVLAYLVLLASVLASFGLSFILNTCCAG